MKHLKNLTPEIDVYRLYLHAYNIMDAERLMRGVSNNRPLNVLERQSIGFGSLILSAFSCELYLKCFIYLDKRLPTATHRLDKLFRQVSHKHQRLITRAWDQDSQNQDMFRQFKPLGMPIDLPNALVRCSNGFEELRYAYEKEEMPTYYLGQLPFILVAILQELKPDWKRVQFHPTQST